MAAAPAQVQRSGAIVLADEDAVAGDRRLPVRVQHGIAPRVEPLREIVRAEVRREPEPEPPVGERVVERAREPLRLRALDAVLAPARQHPDLDALEPLA